MHLSVANSVALLFAGCLSVVALAAGCEKRPSAAPAPNVRPQVGVARVTLRTIERAVGQPAFINAYEQTSIYPKVAGYIKRWNVDIGDRISKDQVMTELFVPELDAEFQQKIAEVAQDDVLIKVAEEQAKVVAKRLDVAAAEVKRAKADVGQYQSAVDRWESEVTRLTSLVSQRVIDKQVLDESQKQLKSNISQREAARAAVLAAESVEMERQADLAKARIDIDAARAKAKVAEAVEKRYAALVSYLKVTAPYDGIVVARNANTGDFVQPVGGDRSASGEDVGQLKGQGEPIYIVARTDLVRVFVDVPEIDANYVTRGAAAQILVQALEDADIKATVTRTSWSLNTRTRSLRAEIDLPNTDAKLLPGMYAYAKIVIRRPHIFAIPADAITELGNQNCCFRLEEGDKAVKTPVQAGLSDGEWTEVNKKLVNGEWIPFSGDEEVITGNLANLTNGQRVSIKKESQHSGSGGKSETSNDHKSDD
jgi:multidrug efflux pump subunit AcrA (membrane-fusion protein)